MIVWETRFKARRQAVDVLWGRRTKSDGVSYLHACPPQSLFRLAHGNTAELLPYGIGGGWYTITETKGSRRFARHVVVGPSHWNEQVDISVVHVPREVKLNHWSLPEVMKELKKGFPLSKGLGVTSLDGMMLTEYDEGSAQGGFHVIIREHYAIQGIIPKMNALPTRTRISCFSSTWFVTKVLCSTAGPPISLLILNQSDTKYVGLARKKPGGNLKLASCNQIFSHKAINVLHPHHAFHASRLFE